MAKKRKFDVVGLHYRLTPATQQKMMKVQPLKGEIRRDRENEHDENALAVYVTEKPWTNSHIGYLRREVAATLAPKFDRGKIGFRNVYVTDFDKDGKSATVLVEVEKPHG